MSGPTPDVWRSRAEDSWAALARLSFRHRPRPVVHEPRSLRAVPLWPFSQVLHTAAYLRAPESPQLLRALEAYRRGPAYAERPRHRRRYYDDNAWIALALLDHGEVEGARRILGFLADGCVRLDDGTVGVRWHEDAPTLHACSTGATGLAALRLAERLPAHEREPLRDLTERCCGFLVGQQGADGLVGDHRRPDGSVDGEVWAYNQGLLVGLLTGLGRVDEAVRLAATVQAFYGMDRLWAEPPVFVAILIRELLGLGAATGDGGLHAWGAAYLERVWEQAWDRRTGVLTGGGIGRYDGGRVLDHAALTGAAALLASR
jgi:predicted alpha-1,6-mannanase (GH76 family)